ncbi:MAG: hypothetical protein HKN76_05785, partial [Saprospiraceae bacterium]|nr:hypothetical protein [Saprospiraceae bacterium]
MKNLFSPANHARFLCSILTPIVLSFLLMWGGQGDLTAQVSPSITKIFSPASIGPGSTTLLTYSLTNPTGAPIDGLSFSDDLGPNVTFADPANAFSGCGGIFSLDGPNTLSFSGGRLGAGSSCSIRVYVTSAVAGSHTSTTSSLTWNGGSSSGAMATLTVENSRPGVVLSFSPGNIPPEGVSRMTLTVDNTANASNITSLFGTVNLPAGLSIALPANAISDCGLGVPTVGTNAISFGQGSSVLAGTSCSISVDVKAERTGNFNVMSSDITFGVGSQNAGFAVGQLSVPRTFLVKSFVDDPALPGGTVNLKYTLTNLDRSRTATNITFTDDLDAALSGLTATGLPSGICNGGSISGNGVLTYSGGQLGPGETCSFVVNLQVPAGAAIDGYTSSTDAVSYELDGESIAGNVATDILYVQTPPLLSMQFTGDPVVPGGEVTLDFSIQNSNSSLGLTDVSFFQSFSSVYFEDVMLPSNGFCGTNSTLVYTPLNDPVSGSATPPSILISGVEIDPGQTCNFDLTLKVPENNKTGLFNNATSSITGLLDGDPVEGAPAADDIVVVSAPKLSKSFTSTKVQAGDKDTITFTLTYGSETASDATAINFTDNLEDFIIGATVVEVVSQSCSGSVDVSDPSVIAYSGGSLSPGTQCTFSVAIQVPAGTAADTYTNNTSPVSSTINSIVTNSPAATADLTIPFLGLQKEFVNDPVIPGGQVDLEFTITNFSANTITNIGFLDNLDETLDGLTYSGPQVTDVCGTGSTLEMIGNNLRFLGGTLDAGLSCSFTVTLDVPANATADEYPNTTGLISGILEGNSIAGDPATDKLVIGSPTSSLVLTKSFPGETANPGDVVDLTFEISFAGAVGVSEATGISFTDDLNAFLAGAQMVGVSTTDNTCNFNPGVPTSLINFTVPSLADGATCSTTVLVKIPDNALSGTKTNTTTTIMADGITGNAASDNLEVLEGDRPPIADAGPDQTEECTGGGSADVTLNASGTTHFVSQPYTYIWQENGVTIANGVQPTVNLS